MPMMLELPKNPLRNAREQFSRRPRPRSMPVPRARRILIMLVSLASLTELGVARAAQLDPEDIMVQEFRSFLRGLLHTCPMH
jgi:hypothetical protein